jgi:hypothetical protein
MTSPVSERVRKAVEARETLGEDFFGGWQPSDIELFQRHARPSQPTANMITDFLGIKIAARFHPWAAYMSGSVNADIPLPNDSLHAEAIEYFAFLHSIECAPPRQLHHRRTGFILWTLDLRRRDRRKTDRPDQGPVDRGRSQSPPL